MNEGSYRLDTLATAHKCQGDRHCVCVATSNYPGQPDHCEWCPAKRKGDGLGRVRQHHYLHFTEVETSTQKPNGFTKHLTHFKDCSSHKAYLFSKNFLDLWWENNSIRKGPECTKTSFVILNVELKKGPQTQNLWVQYGSVCDLPLTSQTRLLKAHEAQC